jgi:non-specific serine/threonine protein kinase/serine/threonine-protein kinase
VTDAEAWARQRELFDELAELPRDEAERRLAALPPERQDLAEAVRALLAADADQRALPVVELAAGAPAADPWLGRPVGAWTVDRLLGAGGMGRVYLAHRSDAAFERQVAVKLLRGALDDPGFRARFARERRIVAALDHPGIARLLDGGEAADGTPFLVLEYVEGEDLLAHCERREADLTARLRLFRRVLDAVAFAHRRLIVHRDLKPSNILVTAAGEPKLLDFGIAKLLEGGVGEPAPTGTGEHLLTPEYASPEQLRGDPVTTGSDVYSLGVVLYELTTGTTPHRPRAGSPAALSLAIEATDAARPSIALERSGGARAVSAAELRGDLDAIVLKALRKEPDRRYGSVDELAADLDRYLEGRPVAARRGGAAYRAGRFARRHRWAIIAAAAGLAVFAGTIAANTLRLRAERDRAERRFAETRELARALLFEIHDAFRDVDGATAGRRLLLERGLHYLERLRLEAGADPSLRREAAEGYLRLAEVLGDRRAFAGLGLAAEGRTALDAGLELAEALAREPGAVEDRRRLARALNALAHQRFDGRLDPGRRLALAESAATLAAALPDAGPDALETLLLRASLGRGRAGLLRMAGRDAEAPALLARAIADARAAARLAPADDRGRLAVATGLCDLGSALVALERPADAVAPLEEARDVLETLVAADPASLERRSLHARVLATLGSSLAPVGRGDEAIEALGRAVVVLEAIVAADPANREALIRLAVARTDLGRAYVETRRYEEAVTRFSESLAALDRASERPGAPPSLHFDRASLLALLGEAARAAWADPRLTPAARETWRRRARDWFEAGLERFDAASAAGASIAHREEERAFLVRALAALEDPGATAVTVR